MQRPLSPDVSAEFAFAAACCVWPPTEDSDAGVAEAAARLGDWRKVPVIGRRHRIDGLIWHALSRCAIDAPEPSAVTLRDRATSLARTSLIQAAGSCTLQARLDDAGIANLVLKGTTLDMLAYGLLGLQQAWDIDILVLPEQVGKAARVLLSSGYNFTGTNPKSLNDLVSWMAMAKECAFRHAASGEVVELHWRAVDSDQLLPGLSAVSRYQRVAITPQMALRTLAPDELFAYLCVHGASHGWFRLKWLADLAALVRGHSGEAIEALYERSLDLGAGTCSAQALCLCQEVLAIPLPEALSVRLRRDIKVRWLIQVAWRAMAGGDGREVVDQPFANDRILLAHLLFDQGWRFRWREFSRQWLSIADRHRISLPSGLNVIYGLIRLPSWFLRRLASRGLSRP